MQKMQCELCDSIDIVKEDTGLYRCQHCGCQYTQEQARAMISGVVELVKGTAELERQMQNAETQMKLGEIDKAMRIYQQLSEEYPHEYRVWWAMVLCKETMLAMRNLLTADELKYEKYAETEFSKAQATCGDANEKARMQRHWEALQQNWKGLQSATITGIRDGSVDFSLGISGYANSLSAERTNIPRDLYDEGIANAKIATGKGYAYGTGKWELHSKNSDRGEIVFLLGRTIAYYTSHDSVPYIESARLEEAYPFSAAYMKKITDGIAEYTKERAIAKKINAADRRKYEKEQVKRGYCPSCYSFLKKTITGKCKKCGWKL